jgi:hypothetical protein
VKRITCPVCWKTSPNPNDVAHLYCGNCHAYTAGQVVDDEATPLGRVRLLFADGHGIELQVCDEGVDEEGTHNYGAHCPAIFTDAVLGQRASLSVEVLPPRSALRLHLPYTNPTAPS